ncbi:MAG TPA: GerMN domain-containing protein [Ruminiclostridium sp.]
MKKYIALFGIALSFTFFFGCAIKNSDSVKDTVTPSNTTASITTPTTDTATTSTPVAEVLQIQDYFPIKENTRYVYEGKGNEYASFDVYIDYASAGKIQQRVDNGGTVLAKVVELKDGKITRLFSREEAYYRENLLAMKDDKEEILLMEPLEKGTTWTLKDSSVRTITNTSVDVTTPAGSYKAIEVTTESPDGKTVDYYAKDVGLIKSVFASGDNEVSSSLSKIEENASLLQKINFYYPNINDNKINYESKDISFKTNDITKQALEKAYKEVVNSNIGKVFTTNTKINSLYLNKDKMVYIDLNKAFLSEMNAGALYEKMILQSVANTFGHYYNSEKVVLTLDSGFYESGHIALGKGEYIKVDYANTAEIKK